MSAVGEKKHPHGEPASLMSFHNGSIVVDYKKISEIFLHPEVADRKIVVVSIVGAFRKGKSFFMDYCLRFMYANVSGISSDFIVISNKIIYLVQIGEFHG